MVKDYVRILDAFGWPWPTAWSAASFRGRSDRVGWASRLLSPELHSEVANYGFQLIHVNTPDEELNRQRVIAALLLQPCA